MSGKMRKVASMLLALILALGLSVGSFAEVLLIDQKQANAPEEGIELDSSDPEAVVPELDINLPVEVDGLSGMVDAEAIAGQDEEMKQSDVVENASAIPDAVTLGVGEKFTIKYVKGRKYTTSNEKVATVSSKGVITAKKKGWANITVKKGKKVLGICTVHVEKAPSKVTLNKKKDTIQEIDTLQLEAKLPKGTFTSKLTWTSSNKSVATVNSEGLVTAKKPGSATITVKTANGKKASCKLTVKKGKRTELQKYLGGDFYAATDKLGLEYDREYSYDIGDATINCVTYSRYDNEGGFLSFDSEDGKHTDFINCASRRYMICGIYVGMTKAQAKKQAKTKKWEYEGEADPDGNGVLYIFYHNSKGHNLTVCVENKKVSHVMLNWNEQFAVTHSNWMDDYSSGDFIAENHEMKPTMEKGDSDFFYINSNIDWTVEKTDVVGKGWLGLSADSGEAGETQLELTVNKLPKVGKTYSSTLVFTTASGRKYSGTVSLTREEEQPKVELSDYMWGDFYSAVEALGLSINTDSDDYTWAKDENHTISIGAFDSNHICDIWTNNSQYTLFGLYAGMTESDALGIIESDGWVMTGSDDDGWSCYVNSQGDDLYLYINDNAVQCVQAHREEQFRVTRAGDDFINNYTALEQNAGVGFTEVLNVESNVRWTVKQIDETVSGWLGISPQKGGEGETTLTLTVKKAPAQGSTYYSTLVFTTEGGNEYSGVVHIGNDVEPVVDPTGITLNETELSLKINDTMSLEATVTPSDANNKTVTWNSDDPYVASVDNNGMITALSAGSTTITAMTCNGIEATCQVTVDEIYPSKVTLDQTSLSLEVDKQVTLAATISPANATATSVTWSSSKASVATVDSSGMVTARAAGTATITVETQNGKTATCVVTVVPQTIDISSVMMSASTLSLKVGDTETLAANPFPLDAAVSSGATWSSSNTAVATVNSKGKVTAKGEGTAIITATIVSDLGTSRTGKCTVTVVNKSLAAPANVSAVMAEVDGVKAKVQWDAVTDNAGYRVYYSETSTWNANLNYETASKGAISKSLTLPDDCYLNNMYFWVAAVDNNGTLGTVSSRCVIQKKTVVPVSVSGHAASSMVSQKSNSSLTISWSKPSNSNGTYEYKVLGMTKAPDFFSSSDSGDDIKSSAGTGNTSFTISSSTLKSYPYLKIAIAARDKNYSVNKRRAWLVFGITVVNGSVDKPVIKNATTGDTFENLKTVSFNASNGDLALTLSSKNGCGKYKVVVIALNEAPDFSSSGSNQSSKRDTTKFDDGYAYNGVFAASYYNECVSKWGGIPIALGGLDNGQYLKIAVGSYAKESDSAPDPNAWTNIGIKITNSPINVNSSMDMNKSAAENMVIGAKNDRWSTKGKIRYVCQTHGSKYDYSSYWVSGESHGGECTRASSSMAVSYLGLDVLPKVSNTTSGSMEKWRQYWIRNYGGYYGETFKQYASGKGDCSVSTFQEMYNRYAKDRAYKYAPPVLYTRYGSNAGYHAIVVIGRDSSNHNVFFAVDPVHLDTTYTSLVSKITLTVINGEIRISAMEGANSKWYGPNCGKNWEMHTIVQYYH